MTETTRRRIDGWGIYLFLLVCLIPIVVPSGPARLAIVDGLIVLGLFAFGLQVMLRHDSVRVPFLVPVFIMAVGSTAAIVNAISPGASFVAIAQDAYLFLWFIMLVHIMRHRDLGMIQKTWMWMGAVIALYGLVVLMRTSHLSLGDIVRPRGHRELSTFYDPNMCAGYLVMSVFFTLSLGSRVSWVIRWGCIGLMLLGIMATKSLGGSLSLIVGLAVWMIARARIRRFNPALLAATALSVVAMGLLAVWLTAGLGVGASELGSFATNSYLARASHSSEGRFTIWKNLEDTYRRYPLGIGPGNSSSLTFSVEQRLRPGSLQAKEAHNDYLAYAIERGPLGIAGLLLMLAMAFGMLWSAGKRADGQPLDDREGALVAAMTGAFVASVVHGLTIEVLHFRHFWMLLAVICVIDSRAKRARDAQVPAVSPVSPLPAHVVAA